MTTKSSPILARIIRGRRRRGVSSVLAMIFVTLFAAIAVGFYASVNTSMEASDNDRHAVEAATAAESGMEFMRWQIKRMTVPGTTTQAQLLAFVASGLKNQLTYSANMGSMTVGVFPTAVNIPSLASQYINLDSQGSGFRADLWQTGRSIVIKVTGRDSTGRSVRAIQMNYNVQENPGTIFGYGMATKGALSLSNGILKGVPDATRGSFLSTTVATGTPLSMSGSANVSGQVYFVNPSGTVSGNGTIVDATSSTWSKYIHSNTPAPEFPSVDPSPYVDYMNTTTMTMITGSTSATPLSNIRIKAGANPSFSGGGTINGLIYIETPNAVTFSGGTHVNGVIVVDNPAAAGTNSITFSGGGVVQGPDTLSPATYGDLTKMTGASILAPNFAVTLTGGSASFGGSILAKSVSLSGGSGGSVSGSVISYGTAATTFSGGSGFTFTNKTSDGIPLLTGVHFSGVFVPDPASYCEPTP